MYDLRHDGVYVFRAACLDCLVALWVNTVQRKRDADLSIAARRARILVPAMETLVSLFRNPFRKFSLFWSEDAWRHKSKEVHKNLLLCRAYPVSVVL